MGILSNRVPREKLQPGDHIYSWRFAYSYAHHGIYVGDGQVIHFTRGQGQELGTGTFLDSVLGSTVSSPSHAHNPCDQCGMDKNCTGVLLSCLDCFLCGYPLYRFEYAENIAVFMMRVRPGTCTLAVSDAPEVVLHRAKYLLENGFGGYHIFRKNCEDFAVYCKTGLLIDDNIIPSGGQAGSFVSGPTSALTAGVVRMLMAEPWGIVAVTAGMYCISRYALDLGNRKDVNKVAVEELVAKVGLVSPLSTEIPSMIDESNAKEEAVAGKFDITN